MLQKCRANTKFELKLCGILCKLSAVLTLCREENNQKSGRVVFPKPTQHNNGTELLIWLQPELEFSHLVFHSACEVSDSETTAKWNFKRVEVFFLFLPFVSFIFFFFMHFYIRMGSGFSIPLRIM